MPNTPNRSFPHRWLGVALAAMLVAISSVVVWRLMAAEEEPPVADPPASAAELGTEAEPGTHAEGSVHTNRLAQSSSPYLLLHKNNPVDWYPWGEEAFARAKAEDKPIFLSIGYSTCYWCHVMERQSFSNPEIAAIMNHFFVSIKVDREERPDLDEVYMTATQLITRNGGWPNSLFLTPELEPFFAGTYFPPEDRPGRPGFPTVLNGLHDAWINKRDQVEKQAKALTAAMRQAMASEQAPADAPPGPELVRAAVDTLTAGFDAEWGGFSSAPKFPSPSNLLLLLEVIDSRTEVEPMLAATLDQMARGGIYDQLGGGFHRYSTDRQWRVPHFEKMLYDNGLLLEVYARWYARSGDPQAGRVVREIAAFLAREMSGPSGGLWSAIDAETDGEEGAFYVWTRPQIEAAIGAKEATFAAPLLGFAGAPFFEGDHFVLHLPKTLAAAATASKKTRAALLERLDPLRAKLLAARAGRPRPLTDDKILSDWNGMAIAGLAAAGEALGDASLTRQATRAAQFVLDNLRLEDGTLAHAWRGGKAHIPAYLDDYAFLIRGLLALAESTGEVHWRQAASALATQMSQRLGSDQGGFYAAAQQPDLLVRTRPVADGAIPSGNAIAVLDLMALARSSGQAHWQAQADLALRAFAPLAARVPAAARTLAIAVHRRGAGATRDAGTPSPKRAAPSGLEAEARGVVAAVLTLGQAGSDGWRPLTVALEIADGWHVNANPASDDFLVPTSIAATAGTLRAVRYPPAEHARFAFAEQPIDVWQGRVRIAAELGPPAGGPARVLLTYQACDQERCLPPVRLDLDAAP